MNETKREIIQFLLESRALKFGDFTLKSGRKAPYFINTGSFDTGGKISTLGEYYASYLVDKGLTNIQTVFGPSYKGIPLAVATSQALYRKHGLDIGFTFNRKEAKTRGEGGLMVGYPLEKGSRTVIVEDVVTAGTTLQEVVPLLRNDSGVEIRAVVVLVDRCERGPTGDLSAVKEAERTHGIEVHPLVTVYDIIEFVESSGKVDKSIKARIEEYLGQYGAPR